jgi:hypothetical protein
MSPPLAGSAPPARHILKRKQENMLPHAKTIAAVLLLVSAFSLGARARELRGGAEREPQKMRRLAVPKGSNCNAVGRCTKALT